MAKRSSVHSSKYVSIHIDVDSPIIISKFYGHNTINYSTSQLELFYQNTFKRAFDLFDEFNIKATFFCVGQELSLSPVIATVIKEATLRGHAIANHTFSHPFGLNTFKTEEITEEITKCNTAIKHITSINPLGFRAPGYASNTEVIEILKKNGISYDSSAGWPLMNGLLKIIKLLPWNKKINAGYGGLTQKKKQAPLKKNHIKDTGLAITFHEFPLPTSYFILPYYHNFHLLFPTFVQNILVKGNNEKHLTYLFHIIEFSSIHDDSLPSEIFKHPNIQNSYSQKLISHRNLLKKILRNRTAVLTENFISDGKI